MENIELKDIGIEEFRKEVYTYYLEIFPEDERKPIELIQSSYEKSIRRL